LSLACPPVTPSGRDGRTCSRPRRTGLFGAGPILAICCLLFIAFLIAATIVLALIPVYLPHKNATPASNTFHLALNYPGTIGNDGSLDSTALNQIARSLERAKNLPTGSFNIPSGTVATTSTRKRRGYALQRLRRGKTSRGVQRIYITVVVDIEVCGPPCRRESPFKLILSYEAITVTLTFTYSGVTVTITVTIIVITDINATTPPTLGPSTTTVSTSTTTVSTSTTTALTSTSTAASSTAII